MVVFSIIAVALLPDSKPIAPPKVAIEGPFHHEPEPIKVEFLKLKFPPPTISIIPPTCITLLLLILKLELFIFNSESSEHIAPPLMP